MGNIQENFLNEILFYYFTNKPPTILFLEIYKSFETTSKMLLLENYLSIYSWHRSRRLVKLVFMFFGLYMNLNHKDTTNSYEARLTMKKYYKKLVSLFKFPIGKRTLKLQTFPTLNLPITSHQYNKEERLQINFVQVVAPLSPLKKSKCKTSRKLKKIQESFLRLRILINIILIKWINMQCNINWVICHLKSFEFVRFQ